MSSTRRGRTSHASRASARAWRIWSAERGSGVTVGARLFHEVEDHLDEDEYDDDDLEELGAEVRRLGGEDLVDALEDLQLLPHVLLPLAQVEARRQEPVRPRQVLVADQLQRVAGPLEQRVRLHLQF